MEKDAVVATTSGEMEGRPLYLLVFLPKFTSTLSILGSSMIISQFSVSKTNRQNMQQRLVFAMSCIDLMVSIVWFSTNLFLPVYMDTNYPLKLGNSTTCTIQGFLVQTSIASPLYNFILSSYYLLVVKYQWSDMRLKKLEKYMHIVPISFGVITAVIVLCLDMYNPASWDCWIAPDININNEENFDSREGLARILQWTFFLGPLWISMIVSSLFMLSIYLHVRKIEKRTLKWLFPSAKTMNSFRKTMGLRASTDAASNNKKSKKKTAPKKMIQTRAVAQQGRLYVISFLVCWLFPTISRLLELCGETIPIELIILSGTVIPCQGFFNAIVYFRMRYKKCRKNYPDKSSIWLVLRIVRLTLCPCCEVDRHNTHDGNDVEYDVRKEKTIDSISNDDDNDEEKADSNVTYLEKTVTAVAETDSSMIASND